MYESACINAAPSSVSVYVQVSAFVFGGLWVWMSTRGVFAQVVDVLRCIRCICVCVNDSVCMYLCEYVSVCAHARKSICVCVSSSVCVCTGL